MQTSLSSADRKLLWTAAAVACCLIAGSFAFVPPPERNRSWIPSSYSNGDRGARAAYLVLERLGYSVRRWEEPPLGLPQETAGATLVLAQPLVQPSAQEQRWLRQFVESGNRILFCGNSLEQYFPEVRLHAVDSGEGQREYQAAFPSYLNQNRPGIPLTASALWSSPLPAHIPVYGDAGGAVLAIWPIGKGEIVWWATAEPLTDAAISKGSNLELFLGSIAKPSRGAKPAVYWDEYFHGERGSLWSYVMRTPLRWAGLQFVLLFLLLLFTYSRRSADVWEALPQRRLSPLEFVETLGGLYEKAKVTAVPVSVVQRDVRLKLTRRLALRLDVEDEDLARNAGERLGWDAQELVGALARARQASNPGAADKKGALRIVRELDRFSKKLDPGFEKGRR